MNRWKLVSGFTAGLVLCLTYCLVQQQGSTSPANLLQLVRTGTHHALTAVKSGRGTVTVRHWSTGANNSVLDTLSTGQIAFAGSLSKISIDTVTLRNDPEPGNDPKLMASPGTVMHRDISVDGNQVTEAFAGHTFTGDCTSDMRAKAAFYSIVADVVPLGITTPGNGLIDVSRKFIGEAPSLGVEVSGEVVGREALDGHTCIVVEFTTHRHSSHSCDEITDLWIDPSRGFTAPRVRMYLREGPRGRRMLVEDTDIAFRQYSTGVWFPSTVKWTRHRATASGGTVVCESKEITYSPDFKINVGPSANELAKTIPSGA